MRFKDKGSEATIGPVPWMWNEDRDVDGIHPLAVFPGSVCQGCAARGTLAFPMRRGEPEA